MRQRTSRSRRFVVEGLEARIALSGVGGVDDGLHHVRHTGVAEIRAFRHGADDPANHNANDDRLNKPTALRKGADDKVGHNVNDVHSVLRGRVRRPEHPAGHR